MPAQSQLAPRPPLARPPLSRPSHVRRTRVTLAGDARTTIHVATYDAGVTSVRLALLRRPLPLEQWCARNGVAEALVGGFFARPSGLALGELRTRGVTRDYVAFEAPWARTRACVNVVGGRVGISARDELPRDPQGDLLQAGPMLVRNGARVIRRGVDPEGFSAGMDQFDSDITRGRYPRAALGIGDGRLFAVAADGRSPTDAGLTLAELADTLVSLGAETALNLDGGGSTSLICAGELRNVPRGDFDQPISGGRPVTTALVFEPRR